MKSIFEEAVYSEMLTRLDALRDDSAPQWRKMKVAQMLSHCQEPLKLALEKSTLGKPGFLKRLLFKSFKNSIYNDKPWKKNLPTAKEYRVTGEKDFATEKKALHALIEEFHAKRDEKVWPVHPLWGKFIPEQWGMSQYKHLDHHFRQFNV